MLEVTYSSCSWRWLENRADICVQKYELHHHGKEHDITYTHSQTKCLIIEFCLCFGLTTIHWQRSCSFVPNDTQSHLPLRQQHATYHAKHSTCHPVSPLRHFICTRFDVDVCHETECSETTPPVNRSQKETGLKTLWSVPVFSHRSVLTCSRRNNVDESLWGLSKRGSIHVRMFPNNLPSWYKIVSFRRVKSAELQDCQLRHLDYRILSMWFTSVLPRMRKWTPTFRQKSQGNSTHIHDKRRLRYRCITGIGYGSF